jgi:holliday junction DNA helicase RuvA
MIGMLFGKIESVSGKSIILMVNGIGFSLSVPNVQKMEKEKETTFFTYLHWNQEKGPSLFGFQSELEKTVFLMVIECPKIGPSIALNILSSMSAEQFLEVVTSQNEAALNAINGIGAKTAEQIVMHLKRKAAKLVSSGEVATGGGFVQWQQINDVLVSLNYSKQEITKALNYLAEAHQGQEVSLDQLIRASLSFLSQSK